MSHASTSDRTSGTYTIKLGTSENYAYTAHSLVKLTAIGLHYSTSDLVHINGFSSRGKEIKNFGFELKANPHLLRDLGKAILSLADDVARHNMTIIQQEMEKKEVELFHAGYSIENCADYKGQYYYYCAAEDYASENFQNRHQAIDAAYADHKASPEERAKIRV